MKLLITSKTRVLIILTALFTFSVQVYAQVGINTTTPSAGAILDVTSSDKGMLVPRVDIADLSTIDPVTGGSTESLLVYNTNATTGPGFFYWDGSEWVALTVQESDDWKLGGNSGTVPGVDPGENFVGTSDDNDLIMARFGIPHINLETNSTILNDEENDIDFRVKTDGSANTFFVDGANDRVGILEDNPQADLHVGGSASTVRVESLNSTNSAFNNGIDNSVVYVDGDGNLVLQDRLDDFPVDASDSSTFFSSPITFADPTGTSLAGVVHSETVVLTRETLIEVSFWTAVNVAAFGGGLVTDGKPRLFGAFVDHAATGTDIVYSASSYTNGILYNDGYLDTGMVTTGFFTIGGNGFITLPAGTHTIRLIAFAGGGQEIVDDGSGSPRPAEGYQIRFGANAFNRFQIVYHN